MGALDKGRFCEELENGVELEDPETFAIEDAVRVLLQGLGEEDVAREGLRRTPLRVAKAFREGTRGYRQKVKDIVQGALFPEAGLDKSIGNPGGAGGLVVVRALDLYSYCESCLLPFQVKCHVRYVPSGQRVVGLSKLSRVSDAFVKRLQEPQRPASEICLALQSGIKPFGVAVVLQCSHLRFPTLESVLLNSSHEVWSKITVTSGSGVFKDMKNSDSWDDFMNLLKFRGLNVDKSQTANCRDFNYRILGRDPLRKELVGTPAQFMRWPINFKGTNLDLKLNGLRLCNIVGPHRSNGEVHGNGDQIHSELNLSFWSQCEHHWLPFHGIVHIGYFSSRGSNPLPSSLLHSIVHFYGFKLQVQERLTRQIAKTVCSWLGGDVMVVMEAYHTSTISRGIEKFGSSTATITVLGQFSTDSSARAKFLEGIPKAIGGS